MTEDGAQPLREDYLDKLDRAIADLPWRVANDLRSGIAEELDGLDAGRMKERIQQLGDPELIAAAAREEADAPAPVVVVAPAPLPTPEAKPAMVDTKWFAIVGAIVLGAGTFVLPIGGWIIGVGLVTSSRFWRRWEKTVAILLPLATAVLIWLFSVLGALWSGGGSAAGPGVAANPVLPSGLDLWHSSFVLGFLTIPAGALWLLWRLRGRERPLR